MNYIVAVSSFIIAYRLFRIPDFIDSLICWFISYLAQVLFVELILGFFGVLYLRNIILVNLAILLIVWLNIILKKRFNSHLAYYKSFLT